MDKLSYYNIVVPYGNKKLVYNTLTNSLVCLENEEFETISQLVADLEHFRSEYGELYDSFKKCGFFVEGDYDELNYIKFMNNKMVYENQKHHVTINPTLDCNLKCWYCSTEYSKTSHSGRMDEAMIEAVKNHMSLLINDLRIPALHLDWFGGEPLMYFDDVVAPISSHCNELAKEHDVVFTQHATTNATYMDEEMMRRMADLRFTSLQIALDGNERRHDLIKRNSDKRGTFKKIVSNINLLPEIIPGISIILRINYDKRTLHGIEDIIPLITDNAKKHISVDFQKVWQINCTSADYEQLAKVQTSFKACGFRVDNHLMTPKKFYSCYADRLHQYVINYDGRVFKCTARGYDESRCVGSLSEDGTVKWKDGLLAYMYSSPAFNNPKCLSCKLLPVCMGPCITKGIEMRKGGHGPDCFMDRFPHYAESHVVNEARIRGPLPGA